MNALIIALFIPGCILGAFGSILLKKGAKKFTLDIRKWRDNVTALSGLFLFGVSSVFYIICLRFERLSVLYPLSSLAYVITAFLSVKMLKEKMNLSKWVGISFIILGSFLVANG